MLKKVIYLCSSALLVSSIVATSLSANETIAELYTKKSEFAGKTVTIKGTVLKISRAIMKKDWITISDGTSAEDKNSIIFTATSKTTESLSVGSKVTATGVLELDLDLGFPGYKYPVIIQSSKFLK